MQLFFVTSGKEDKKKNRENRKLTPDKKDAYGINNQRRTQNQRDCIENHQTLRTPSTQHSQSISSKVSFPESMKQCNGPILTQ